MGSRGSDCTKSVIYGRWVAEGEAIRSSRGGRGRKYYASDPAEAGEGGNIIVILLLLSWVCFCGEPGAGIIWQEKKLFPTESGKYPGGGGKKLNLKIWDNCTGHCSTANDKKKAHNREKMRAKLNVLEFILVLSCYRATILARW